MTNSYFNENSLEDLLEEIKFVYQLDERPWIIGYSGGKDSTVLSHLVYLMLKNIRPEERTKYIHIVSSDTLVENPLIKQYLDDMLQLLGEAAKNDKLPIVVKKVMPAPDTTFWANVIGRGFPTPRTNGTFRWCTDRLKIAPSGTYIDNIIATEKTEVVVLLGVRKEESIARKRRIEGRELADRLLNRHETIKQAYVYPAIVELTTDDVWKVLMGDSMKNAWGGDNGRIIELYSDADGGECPFAGFSSKDAQPQTCGQSRFGCWVCTVVKEDKSLNGFIKTGHRELIPFAEFRKWLMSIRDVPEKKLAELSQANEESAHLQKKFAYTTKLLNVFQEYLNQMLEEKRQLVEEKATEVFMQITNNPKKYKGICIANNYSLMLELTDGGKYQIEPGRTLNPSTGQSKVISLAYIAGLNRSTNYAAPVVIDNPLGLFSDEHRAAITKYLPHFGKQIIFMVSSGDLSDKYHDVIKPYVKTEYFLENCGDQTWPKTTIAEKKVY